MAAIAEPTITTRTRPRYTAPALPQVAAIYTRVSSKRQGEDDKTSLETQEAACRALATAEGFPVSVEHTYIDVHTGEELHERRALSALREAAKRHEFARLYVNSTDRLSRDPIHLGIVVDEMERAGVTYTFVIDPLDDSQEGQIIRFVKGISSKVDNAKRREATMRGRRGRAERGKLIPGARPLYGYTFGPERDREGKLTKERLVPDQVTAPIVRRIYQDAATGATIRGIAAALTAEGIPTPTGKHGRWDPTTIHHLLAHPTYHGHATALRYKLVPVPKHLRAFYATKHRSVKRPESEAVQLPESVAPALVSPELAAHVAARMRLNQRLASRNNPHPEDSLLRGGIARCGYCGYTLGVNRKRPHISGGHPQARVLYRCCKSLRVRGDCTSHGITAQRLDDTVWAKVCEVLRDPTIIEQEVARMRETDEPGADVLATIDRQLAEVARRIKNKREYAELIDDPRERADIAGDVKLLLEQRSALEAERSAAQTHYAQWQQDKAGLERLVDWCQRVGDNLEAMTYDQRRGTLLALKAEVKLYRAEHEPRAEMTITLPLSGSIPLTLDTLDVTHSVENVRTMV
jgi:site-specific DNA recombinase